MAESESSQSLCTLTRVKQLIFGATYSGTTHDTTLINLIDEVSQWVRAECGLSFRGGTSITEYHDVVGDMQDLYPRVWPVTAVASVYEDSDRDYGSETELLEANDDIVIYLATTPFDHPGNFIRRYGGCWAQGDKIVKLTYTGGYSTVAGMDSRISGPVAAAVAWHWQQYYDGGKRLGVSSVSKGDGSVSQFGDDLPEHIQRGLALIPRVNLVARVD